MQEFKFNVKTEDLERYVNAMLKTAQDLKIDPPIALFVLEEASKFIRQKFGIVTTNAALTPYEEIAIPKEKGLLND